MFAAFIPPSDFFTLEVADFTGKAAEDDAVEAFFEGRAPCGGR